MNAVRWSKVTTAAAVLLAFAAATPRASAQPISSISGTRAVSLLIFPIPPAGPVGNSIVEGNLESITTQFNGAPIPGGNVNTIFPGIVTATVTGASTSGGVTTYTLAGDPATKILVFTPAQGGGLAFFDFSFTQAVVDAATPNVVTFSGMETLASNSNPTFDFSPFAAGGTIAVTLTALPGTNFNAVLSADTLQELTAAGTFTQTATVAVIPEPATWALLGAGLPLLAGYWRRRRRA